MNKAQPDVRITREQYDALVAKGQPTNDPHVVQVRLTPVQLAKLVELAAQRTKEQPAHAPKTFTVETCLQELAEVCQPGGGGWRPPSAGKKL